MLTKLSTFSGVAPDGEPLVQLFHQGDNIEKVAGSYHPDIQAWLSTYKSDAKKIAILVNALGGSEYWGQNTNGDVFPWGALVHDCAKPGHSPHPIDPFTGKVIPEYGYKTFLNARPYVHHRNKNPNRAFGSVVVSCLNHTMKRVELVALIDRDLASMFDAQSFVDRIDLGEFPDVSMGCRVPYDVCTLCGHLSKTKDDYCDHVKILGMNRILDDGRRIGVINYHPRFFDISFVFIGADRTAKMMCKLASANIPSVYAADLVYAPEQPLSGFQKTASGILMPSDTALEVSMRAAVSRVKDRTDPPGKRLLDELAVGELRERQKSPASRSALCPPLASEAGRKGDFASTRPGHQEGVLRTNAYDSVEAPGEGIDKQGAGCCPGKKQRLENLMAKLKERRPDVFQKEAQDPLNKRAVIIKGNPDLIRSNRAADRFYQALSDVLKSKGYSVSTDPGEPKTSPPEADLWVGHSRGIDRLQYAPKGTKTIAIGSPGEGGVINHPLDTAEKGKVPDKYHYTLSKGMKTELRKLAAASKELAAPPVRAEFPYAGQYLWNGMTILVENPKGTWRVGKGWKTHMLHDYGEIKGSLGSDGDPVDVYVGPKTNSKKVFIVHQNFAFGPKEGQYDEDKCMLGFGNSDEAKKAYLVHYNSPKFFRSITEMDLDQFKTLIFSKEGRGEKLAMEKVAESLSLEDLFQHGNVRRERAWKDKVTGKETKHVGSGLGSSFDTMQKTAAKTAAHAKKADIDKKIDPNEVTGRIVENLTDAEECLDPELLNDLGQNGLQKALSTTSAMGMVLKPEEFQRLLLSAIGKGSLADELDARGVTFPVRSSGGMSAPCDCLSSEQIPKGMISDLEPALEGRSYHGPVVQRRIIRVSVLRPKKKPVPTTENSPLLTKMSSAYNWYRSEMLKMAANTQSVMSQYPQIQSAVLGIDDLDLFEKRADADLNSVGAMIASIPVSLMYSAALRRDADSGEDLGLLKKVIADHPHLFALASGAATRELMKHPDVNRIVGNLAREAGEVGKRVILGGA